MNRSVNLREQGLDFMCICRAIFHGAFFQGGSLPFLQNGIMKIERKKSLHHLLIRLFS